MIQISINIKFYKFCLVTAPGGNGDFILTLLQGSGQILLAHWIDLEE